MVNEVVGSGEWEDSSSLGETWRSRNVFSYGRNEGSIGSSGTARPAVLDKLLASTERVVQEIDSVEYGLTDIQGRFILCSGKLSTVCNFCLLPRVSTYFYR
jgi:magnesium chelatase subunit H